MLAPVGAICGYTDHALNMPPTVSTRKTVFAGLVTRQERWSLSLRGWLLVALLCPITAWGFATTLYPFFAVTHRVEAQLLAVEGWVHDYAIRGAVEEFNTGRYHRIVATGGPVQGMGGYVNDYSTAASIGAGRLKAAGIPADRVQMAPSRIIDRDRTYNAALALRDWIHARQLHVTTINVLTEDVHGRRTRLLFQKAFGNDVTIGVIAVPSPDYDSKRWWRYSEGVRDVLGETISYIYAKLFFFPTTRPNDSHAMVRESTRTRAKVGQERP